MNNAQKKKEGVKMIKCPNCGAGMYFDIKSQKLHCPSCDSDISVSAYNKDIDAEEHTYETTLYLCKSCGAQLAVPDEQATAFCPYCGNQSMIPSKIRVFETNKIIPFRYTKEDILERFGKYVSHKLFVPKDYKRQDSENSFRGVYVPHYNYKVNYKPGTFFTAAHHDFNKGNEHHHVTYTNEISTDGGYSENIVRDASAAFDDSLSAAIAPYVHSEAVTFREAYLGDFYADIPSVNSDVYSAEVTGEAVDELKESIEKSTVKKDIEHDFEDDKLAENIETGAVRADLYPVWFMTRRMKSGRIAYAVANGQTGKMAMDLPVSKGKFFAGVSVTALALFALSTLGFGYISAGALSGICCLILALSLMVLCFAVSRVYKRESGTISALSKKPENTVLSKTKKKLKNISSVSTLVVVVFISVHAISFIRAVNIMPALPVLICLISLLICAAALAGIIIFINSDGTFMKYMVNSVLSVALIAACLILNTEKPIQDYWYVGAAIISQAAVIFNCLSVIGLFDRLCTHPVPDLFTRKGAAQDD